MEQEAKGTQGARSTKGARGAKGVLQRKDCQDVYLHHGVHALLHLQHLLAHTAGLYGRLGLLPSSHLLLHRLHLDERWGQDLMTTRL